MTEKLNTSSVNGSSSRQQSLSNTGRTENTGEILPTLLPTPTARDYKGRTSEGRQGAPGLVNILQSSPAASLASHSAKQGEEKERQMIAISGQTCLKLYEMSNPTGSLLRTCVASLLGTTAWYSNKSVLTWKAKVTKSNRLLFQLSPSTRRTEEIESGLLHTARANDSSPGWDWNGSRTRKQPNNAARIALLSTPNTLDSMEPKTPKALLREATVTRPGRTNLSNLRDQIAYGQKMPTPEAIQTGTVAGKKLRLQPAMTQWMMGYPNSWTEFPTQELNGETKV